jgi:hypothetical protein
MVVGGGTLPSNPPVGYHFNVIIGCGMYPCMRLVPSGLCIVPLVMTLAAAHDGLFRTGPAREHYTV